MAKDLITMLLVLGEQEWHILLTVKGNAILALGSNGVHLRWKWPKDDDLDQSGQATAKVTTQLWQLKNSLQLLINDVSNNNPEASVSCFALSKNNSYLFSTSGKTITLFNLITYEAMTNFLPPAPMATCIAFYPQNNNIIAIGMDDSIILIYNVPMAQKFEKRSLGTCECDAIINFTDAEANSVCIEPQEPEGKWFMLPPDDVSVLQPPSLPKSSEQPPSLPESSELTKPMPE
ncbi:hypothetical protein LWI28_022138 [Acer negundo]|uniref:Uncharacterized protein n=1 Tax=Acer negundo TaxID=4023 RepID=A0AAD5JBK7_ACENE|nr:hypothetical protein LWI28_022138 [Acer negundo]